MQGFFEAINGIFSFIGPLSDFLWEFPTNIEWYAKLPILGNFSFAIILLLGSGIYFSFKLKFIQVTHFNNGVRVMTEDKQTDEGLSPMTAFLLSSAMRLGPGNIIGVTGAIAVGGPGALFWMWVSAFFGMALAYMEAVLAQIFKEKKENEFVGGLAFYGRRLLGNKVWIGIFLSVLYILYACFSLPAYGFNVVASIGEMTEIITDTTIETNSTFYYVVGALVVGFTALAVFGGIHGITKWTDRLVPIVAVLYMGISFGLILLHLEMVPYFFYEVFHGAFCPDAVFGGMLGVAVAQGVKRGLMTHEAGQGTITMSAASASANHPCEQGILAAIGVFFDTIIVCTLTGFVLIMAHCWDGAGGTAWLELDKLPMFIESVKALIHGETLQGIIVFLVIFCFGLFTYACLLGMVSFSEIAANRISRNKRFINGIRVLCLGVASFGILCNLAGLELGNLWAFSDLGNILIVLFNVPIVFVGAKCVYRATEHYKKKDGTPFSSQVVGREDCEYWDERAKK